MNTKPYALGMDIGGTNTVCGVVDREGKVLCSNSIKTQQYPVLEGYIQALATMIDGLCQQVGGKDKVQGLGVGAPNANYYNGKIELAPNLPWKGIIPFAELVSQAVGLPVRITNDANAAALGEMAYGVAKGMKHFIMITLGTGVGSGIVIDGKMVYGHDGFAGELGHVIVKEDGRLCGCGRKGCLETYCSATGIARTAREYVENTDIPSLLRNVKPEAITSKDIYDAAVQGDELAVRIFRETGTILGKALANMVVFSSPEAIVLFGGLAKAGDFIMRYTREAMDASMLPIFKGKTKLLLSGLKDAEAAVLGASALGWESEE